MKTVYDLILEERERNKPTASCDTCGIEYDKLTMWSNGSVYRCDKCFNSSHL